MNYINMLEVRLRNGFSDRTGIKEENTNIQLTDLDDRTRMALVNAVDLIWYLVTGKMTSSQKNPLLINILSDVYVQQVSYSSNYDDEVVKNIVFETIKKDDYDAVLTVVEYVAQKLKDLTYQHKELIFKHLNNVFEQEFVGYRFVNESITPISDEIEINEVEVALNSPNEQVRSHLAKSLGMLSDRDSPDYENSIKESISAVECVCAVIIGKATTLGNALNTLEKAGLIIHPSMKIAFEKLYGYTSDGTGIRHSGKLGGPKSTFEEAKFMLVSCCAFVNYLVGAMSKYQTTT